MSGDVWTEVVDLLKPPIGAESILVPRGARPALVARLGRDHPLVVITASTRDAEDLMAQLPHWAPDRSAALLPAWETLPHERLSPSADVVGNRLGVLRRLVHPIVGDPLWGEIHTLVVPVRALMQRFPADLAHVDPVVLAAGRDIDLLATARRLVEFGYERCDLVERRGQFATRGGILDVFPPTEPHPVRAELWGDTIEEVRSFAVGDQRMLERLDRAVIAPPCRELLLTEAVRDRAAQLAAGNTGPSEDLGAIAEGLAVPGMESLAALLVPNMASLFDLLDQFDGDRAVVIGDGERVRARGGEALRTADEFAAAAWSAASSGGKVPMAVAAGAMVDWEALLSRARESELPVVDLTGFRDDAEAEQWDPGLMPAGPFATPSDALAAVRRWAADSYRVLIVASGPGPAQRLGEVLRDDGIPATLDAGKALAPGVVTVAVGALSAGFLIADERVVVLSEREITSRSTARGSVARLPSRRGRTVDPLSLRPGDFLVHDKHGIGRYVELMSREVHGTVREYLVCEYAPGKRGHPPDRLFVPTDQLDSISRYVGGEQPALNKLGGSDWAAAKGRARKAVKQIAAELVRLYAARQSAPGYAFGPDTPWQAELEDTFEYVETPDQLSCVDEVKADMRRAVPMDRLICGDVGYGKTEIAVRAAFKAVQEGKQVAILVPTTLLVQQHSATFTERYAGFPISVAALSRFRSAKGAADVIERLADGRLDVVIGTHRLLTPQVRFKDLGLVIIDEEQRFGVEHKEHLKALRANVDVLSMSATPIPRTLEMAVTGIREMSTITTPPEERLPVLTHVGAYDERQISAAVHRELLRDGQVFFVHNRVESIDRVAARVRELVPEATVAVAHGQMPESALEQVILDFWERRIDVLVCTTIVESGLDIANANTLIVDRADTFGLSQLHQLRGRVGRSRSRAYAYFLYSPHRELSETAHERLATIVQNTDLGAGMQVALKDLEIRGAGNLLGGEQSGHIAEVGFDLYVRMVGEALADFKGETPRESEEIRIDLPVEARIPHNYVPEERLRLEAYQRLSGARSDQELDELTAELADRYGPFPEEVANLIAVARLRVLAKRAGLTELVQVGSRVRLHPVELPDSRTVRLTRLYRGSVVKRATRQILVPMSTSARGPEGGRTALDWAAGLVKTVLLD